MSATRIYVVQLKGAKPRLIDAQTLAQSIRHVAKSVITAKAATAKETAELMKQGIQLESAVEVEADEQDDAAEE